MFNLFKKRSKKEILFTTVKEDNILPITSICKLNCIFCSHKNNPSEVETYSFGHLEFDLIKNMIEFLNPEQPVFIGESASKIIEGEPFVHPKIYQILEFLRLRWPEIEIKITTSGSFLDLNKIELLKSLEPLKLNISLNGPAPEERVFLMNDINPENVFKLIPELKEHKLDFEASIVSMHHLKGFKYLQQTFEFLEAYQPQGLRIFMAGFSRYAEQNLIPNKNQYKRLNDFVKNEKNKYSYPIIIEPQLISSLSAEINAVAADTPAAAAGLRSSDIILEVEKQKIESRVDAFYKLKSAFNPEVLFRRNQKIFDLVLYKEKNEDSGLIFSYDLSVEEKRRLKAYASETAIAGKNKATIVVSSKPAYNFLESFLCDYLKSEYNLSLTAAKNDFFGGSIIAAGLLCNRDLIKTLNKFKRKIDRIILPQIIYDYYGNDILGEHYSKLEAKFEAEIILI